MKTIIVFLVVVNLTSCANSTKCPNAEGFNPVVERPSCRVRIRNTFFADQLSPDIKEKMKQGQQLEFVWVPTAQKGPTFIPAHFQVKTVLGESL